MSSEYHLLDTHCHVGSYEDPVSVLDQARAASVDVIAVTGDPGEYRLLRTRLGRRPGVQVAIGLHPLKAASLTRDDLARFFRLLPQSRWVGEVGLDFSRVGIATQRQQREVFEAVLTEAQPGHHPLTVHSRGAEEVVIKELTQARCPAVLHWYSGPLALVDDALAAGLYFSINPAMIRTKKISQLLALVPRDRVLLETDGPFAKLGARPAQPNHVRQVVQQLARVWGTSDRETSDLIVLNQRRILETI